MAFTVADFSDLTRLLAERPRWQAELRRLILSDDFLGLPQAVRELGEAQRRTEAQVQRLAAAQQRTEVVVQELAAAQQRTEVVVQELVAELRELAQAQRRTEERVDGLATAVGELQRAFGATIEEEAESFVQALLEGRGYRLLIKPYSLALDGEVDVVMQLEDPSGETVWAVVEAKARLGYRQVRDWGQRMKSSGWQQRLADNGIPGPYLVYVFGIRVDPGAVRAAEEQGIGLLTGRGERVSPKGLVRSPAG